MSAINLNLSGAYRVTEGLSLGLGVNAVYAKAQVERNAGIIADSVKDNQVKLHSQYSKNHSNFLISICPLKTHLLCHYKIEQLGALAGMQV